MEIQALYRCQVAQYNLHDIIGEISAVDHFKYLKAEMTSVKV